MQNINAISKDGEGIKCVTNRENLAKKHFKIRCWLEEIFSSIPSYEVTEETIAFLHAFLEQNKAMNRLATFHCVDIQTKSEEYKLEGERIKNMLTALGLSIPTLSNAGKSSVKSLADVAMLLDIKDTQKSSYLLAMSNLADDIQNIENLAAKKEDEFNKLVSQMTASLQNVNNVKRYGSKYEEEHTIDESIAEKRRKDTINLRNKADNYASQIIASEVESDPHITHETLLRLAQEVKELKSEVQPLLSKYKMYRSLPPDVNLAKVKIEEAKRQLMKLEAQLQTDIDLLTL
ncbi:uncharacterized protein LOC130650130 [Hydractinia symbiolongicarpus]|uniref:uncharacterized protein LOC130650130 n=1 Tax=Hydractinia symbiolongicarpus TaxID=13093 RepID=UPI00254FA8E6|nr:uncharacterized protein LOC130650130 [Hydractinia symbiolongicarpus]